MILILFLKPNAHSLLTFQNVFVHGFGIDTLNRLDHKLFDLIDVFEIVKSQTMFSENSFAVCPKQLDRIEVAAVDGVENQFLLCLLSELAHLDCVVDEQVVHDDVAVFAVASGFQSLQKSAETVSVNCAGHCDKCDNFSFDVDGSANCNALKTWSFLRYEQGPALLCFFVYSWSEPNFWLHLFASENSFVNENDFATALLDQVNQSRENEIALIFDFDDLFVSLYKAEP